MFTEVTKWHGSKVKKLTKLLLLAITWFAGSNGNNTCFELSSSAWRGSFWLRWTSWKLWEVFLSMNGFFFLPCNNQIFTNSLSAWNYYLSVWIKLRNLTKLTYHFRTLSHVLSSTMFFLLNWTKCWACVCLQRTYLSSIPIWNKAR